MSTRGRLVQCDATCRTSFGSRLERSAEALDWDRISANVIEPEERRRATRAYTLRFCRRPSEPPMDCDVAALREIAALHRDVCGGMLLLLKLTLAPMLVAMATLATRRWGPSIGGIVVGLPLSTAPIFLFLAIDQGLDFAERAAVGILFGLVGVAAFAMAYVLASRHLRWPVSLALAAVAFFAASASAGQLPAGVFEAGLTAYAALLMVVAFIRRPQLPAAKVPSPWWDIWFRMGAAAALTLAITAAADRLGPLLSGIVGTYPVVTTVVTTFTHHHLGREAAIAMMRSSVLAWFGFVSCFLVIGMTLKSYGLAASLCLGALAAVATTVAVFWIDRRMSARAKLPAGKGAQVRLL